MNVLLVHNVYQQRGGEDSVVDAEVALLRSQGQKVYLYSRHNDDITTMGRLATVFDTFWSRQTTDDFDKVVADFQPDIVHVHNTFPLISASIYWAAEIGRAHV